MVKISLHNLGCKVNSYELDKIARELNKRGYEITDFREGADIYVVNTCTVTNIADRKSRQMLHRAKKLNPAATVIAIGCYVDTSPDCAQKDDCIDIALSNKEKERLPDLIDEWVKKNNLYDPVCECKPYSGSHARAYVKIQDGCNMFCTYCVIPFARGRSVSRPIHDVLNEVNTFVRLGIKEVVLTGIHISSYGLDLKNESLRLHELVKLIDDIHGLERIRLGSLEASFLTDEAINTLASCKKLCPHFHISLQSGCDSVLKRMNRHYTTDKYAATVNKLRLAFNNPAITTDIITGFPNETQEEFEESLNFVEKIDFYETHVFPYSARKGTKAAEMEGGLPSKLKAERADVLIKLSRVNFNAQKSIVVKEVFYKYFGHRAG